MPNEVYLEEEIEELRAELSRAHQDHRRRKLELEAQVLHVRLLRYIWDNERRAFDYDMFHALALKLLGEKSGEPWKRDEVNALIEQIEAFSWEEVEHG